MAHHVPVLPIELVDVQLDKKSLLTCTLPCSIPFLNDIFDRIHCYQSSSCSLSCPRHILDDPIVVPLKHVRKVAPGGIYKTRSRGKTGIRIPPLIVNECVCDRWARVYLNDHTIGYFSHSKCGLHVGLKVFQVFLQIIPVERGRSIDEIQEGGSPVFPERITNITREALQAWNRCWA